MSLENSTKQDIISKFQLHGKDNGSADVQIAVLTEKIQEIHEHLKINPKDHASRLAMIRLIGQRRRLLDYLNKTDTVRYRNLIARLKIRK